MEKWPSIGGLSEEASAGFDSAEFLMFRQEVERAACRSLADWAQAEDDDAFHDPGDETD